MTLAEFNNILAHPNQINTSLTHKIEDVLEAYPYFQTARVLYLKGLQNQDNFKFNSALKKTAAYCTDRTVLFDFIVSEKGNGESCQTEKNKLEDIDKLHKKIGDLSKDNFKKTEEVLEIGKPIAFATDEKHSFNEWLQLGNFNPIKRESTPHKFDLIEQFIKSNPKIKPLKKEVDTLTSTESFQENLTIMTETLAKVYLEQKKYAKAIKAYKILSLKYPEKSSFFADRIKAIQFLQKHNISKS